MPHSADNLPDQLDRDRLLELYEDDTEMMISSFEMFLDEVLPNFLEFENLIALQDWAGVTMLTHQLRPWLGMVGLTGLENKLWAIEKQAKKEPDGESMMNLYYNFNENLLQMMPVLKNELEVLTK